MGFLLYENTFVDEDRACTDICYGSSSKYECPVDAEAPTGRREEDLRHSHNDAFNATEDMVALESSAWAVLFLPTFVALLDIGTRRGAGTTGYCSTTSSSPGNPTLFHAARR